MARSPRILYATAPALLLVLCVWAAVGSSIPADTQAAGELRVPADWVADVTDLTSGFPGKERDAYYRVLQFASGADPARLRAAGERNVKLAEERFRSDPANARRRFSLFYEIAQHPQLYRGKLFTLRGYLQRLETMDAGENDVGLSRLHEGYLFTPDSLQSPYVVVSSEMTAGIPIPRKGRPTNDVEVTGLFFKLWSYDAERSRWAAPLLLARSIDWHPRPPSLASRPAFRWMLGGGLVAILIGLVVLTARQRSYDRRMKAARAAHADVAVARDLADLQRRNEPP